eukprot:539679_1
MKAQSEAMENEIRREKRHLSVYWDEEMDSLRQQLSDTMKLKDETVETIIDDLKSHKNRESDAVQWHGRLELGIDPDDTGNPWKAAIYSFICFSIGAMIPLLPYLMFQDNNISYKLSIGISILTSIILGLGLALLNGVPKLKTCARQSFA